MRGHAASGNRKFNKHWQSSIKKTRISFLMTNYAINGGAYFSPNYMIFKPEQNLNTIIGCSHIRIRTQNIPNFRAYDGGILLAAYNLLNGQWTTYTSTSLYPMFISKNTAPTSNSVRIEFGSGYDNIGTATQVAKARIRKYDGSSWTVLARDPSVEKISPGYNIYEQPNATATRLYGWQIERDFDITYNLQSQENVDIVLSTSNTLHWWYFFFDDSNFRDTLDDAKNNFRIIVEFW